MKWRFGRGAEKSVHFRCNVCSAQCRCSPAALGREDASCHGCGSTVRMRAIVHHLSQAIFGESLALPDFPHRPDIRGIGLSDWEGYARRLASRVDYTNTYYHTEPFLDVTQVPDDLAGSCDFVISTDVFEHVSPPVSKAFEGALRLLKPAGTLILTVPFMLEETETREHFPRLHQFELRGKGKGPFKLVNTCQDGTVEEFDDLIFHGGPGSTLEMRVFAKDSLQRELAHAGFSDIRFADQAVPEFGIFWQVPWSIPVTARAPLPSARALD